MGPIVRRAILPLLLVAGGIASLVYGAAYHRLSVARNQVEEQMVMEEREETIQFPPAFSPASPEGQPPEGGLPFAPPPQKVKIIVRVPKRVLGEVSLPESEPDLIREITHGGLALTDSGMLKRTYGPTENGEEAPPSLCPS